MILHVLPSPPPSSGAPVEPPADAVTSWMGQVISGLGGWFGDIGAFLNAAGNSSWMHTLLDGLVSAIIGALVALFIVLFTVKAQNAGIAEQLRTQRRENARAREHAAAAEVLRTLQGIQDSVGKVRMTMTDSGVAVGNVESTRDALQPLFADLRVGFERLRLDLKDDDDAVIAEFLRWVWNLER